MGFEEPSDTVTLVIEGDYAGAEVKCLLNVPLSVYFGIARAQSSNDTEAAFRLLGDEVLDSWNVTLGGVALPATGDGMLMVSPKFATMIVGAWVEAAANPPAPLGESSGDGLPFPAAPIPMETLSASLSS